MTSSKLWKSTFLACSLLALAAFGCSQSAPPPTTAAAPQKSDHDEHAHGEHGHSHSAAGHDHGGWWCAEHGVPEGICSLCSREYAAEAQKKGDWCEEHARAKSQCFLCDPKLKEKFAARYRAKFGKEPPPTEDEEKKDSKS